MGTTFPCVMLGFTHTNKSNKFGVRHTVRAVPLTQQLATRQNPCVKLSYNSFNISLLNLAALPGCLKPSLIN